MDCSRIPSWFSARLDQDLGPAEQAAFRGHLDGCPSCCDQWRSFQATVKRVHDLESLPAPSDLLPKILAAVAEHPPQLARSSWLACFVDYWRRRDFSVSLPTTVATVAMVMVLAVLVKGSLPPASLPDLQANSVVAESSRTQLTTERPRLLVPGATPASTARPRTDHLSPSLVDVLPAPSLSFRLDGIERPDILVVFHDAGPEVLATLFRQCFAHPAWRVGYFHREMLLLELPTGELPRLRAMLAEHPAAITPLAAFSAGFGADKTTLRVAISSR